MLVKTKWWEGRLERLEPLGPLVRTYVWFLSLSSACYCQKFTCNVLNNVFCHLLLWNFFLKLIIDTKDYSFWKHFVWLVVSIHDKDKSQSVLHIIKSLCVCGFFSLFKTSKKNLENWCVYHWDMHLLLLLQFTNRNVQWLLQICLT